MRIGMAGDFTFLAGKHVLVVEDEHLLAAEMADAVHDAGGIALGPASSVERALAIISGNRVDAAVLDINLGTETSIPVAAALKAKRVRIVFVTGYDDWMLPSELADTPVCRKPADPDTVVRRLFP